MVGAVGLPLPVPLEPPPQAVKVNATAKAPSPATTTERIVRVSLLERVGTIFPTILRAVAYESRKELHRT